MGISDLVLQRRCVGCGCQNVHLCVTCQRTLASQISPQRVRTSPVPVYAAATYDGVCRQVVLAAKRTGQRVFIDHLATLLSLSLRCLLVEELTQRAADECGKVGLVPIHSGSATRRSAGQDLVASMLKLAVRRMRSPPSHIAVVDVLVRRPALVNQKELNRDQRRHNVRGRFVARPDERLAGLPVVLVDDVMTTGSTLAAARTALEAGGVHVAGATVAVFRP